MRRTRAAAVTWWVCLVVLLVGEGAWAVRKTSWYLAVDQYGYLTFARDLARGHFFHEWPPMQALGPAIPPTVDVLSQTYVWDRGRMHSRYAAGYPLLLAGTMRVFGEDAAHLTNAAVLLLLLATYVVLCRRLSGDRWTALAALGAVLAFPTLVTRWALTPLRDLPATWMALSGLLLLTSSTPPGLARLFGSAVALGLAIAVRPDAVLYLVPASLLVALRWGGTRGGPPRLAAVAAGLLLGLLPLLVANALSTGSAVSSTQAMETSSFWSSEPKPGSGVAGPRVGRAGVRWQGGTAQAVEGGGLRLAHLPRTLPGLLVMLQRTYGEAALTLAALGGVLAAVGRRRLLATWVPYGIAAILFYGCWIRADPRYLTGVMLLLGLLVVEGALGLDRLVRSGAARWGNAVARVVAACLAVGFAAAALARIGTPNPAARIVAAAAAATSLAAATPRRATWVPAALAIALAALVLQQVAQDVGQRGRFQQSEVEQARATLSRVVPPGSVVIATEDVGRPAENVDYYADGVSALYLTDLARWRLSLFAAASLLIRAGLGPYLLLPRSPGSDALVRDLRGDFAVDLVADVEARDAPAYFVAVPNRGEGPIQLFRIRPRADPTK